MASLLPVTAGQPVGEARFVRSTLLPVRTPLLRRVFRDSDHAECPGVNSQGVKVHRFDLLCVVPIGSHHLLLSNLTTGREWCNTDDASAVERVL